MCSNIPYTDKEMSILSAIYKIDPTARFKIKGKLETRMDFMYGGIEWESDPIKWEQVVEKMYELK
tara:strand:- start:1132 stop:1326 length:195 start_codon:yes stop_codon:yes gene_type:complete